jgi:hypothetical protein
VALAHHERWDGSGYPSKLAGEAIPLSGRIVAVVDFFDALTMDRCYRPAFDDDQALEMLRSSAAAPSTRASSTPSSSTADELIACATASTPTSSEASADRLVADLPR